jgi:hypothetical protein
MRPPPLGRRGEIQGAGDMADGGETAMMPPCSFNQAAGKDQAPRHGAFEALVPTQIPGFRIVPYRGWSSGGGHPLQQPIGQSLDHRPQPSRSMLSEGRKR